VPTLRAAGSVARGQNAVRCQDDTIAAAMEAIEGGHGNGSKQP
jgi:hypothetical protein